MLEKISVIDKNIFIDRLEKRDFKLVTLETKCIDVNDDRYYEKPILRSIILKNDLIDKVDSIGWQLFIIASMQLLSKDNSCIYTMHSSDRECKENEVTVKNNIFSATFKSNLDYVFVNKGLIDWLEYNHIWYKDILGEIGKDTRLSFDKCSDIQLLDNGTICYSSDELVLENSEIEELFKGINNKLLKLKISSILEKYGRDIVKK